MKKAIVLLLLCTLLLTGCTAPVSSTTSQPEETPPEPAATTVYSPQENPYNLQTSAASGAIYAQEDGAIYRVDTATGSIETLLDNESLGHYLPYSPSLVVVEDFLYFLALTNVPAVQAGTADTFTTGLFRADADGQNATQVATIESGLHTLYLHGGYIVAYYDYFGEAPLPLDESHKIFRPDSTATSLEPVPSDSFDDAWFAALTAFREPWAADNDVFEQAGYKGDSAAFASTVHANGAHYVFDHYTDKLGHLPDGGIYEIIGSVNIPPDNGERWGSRLLNYDGEWLYIKSGFSLYRVRRDGSATQLCVKSGVGEGKVDIVGGYAFYTGTSGRLHMCDLETGETTLLGSGPEGEMLEAVRLEEKDARFLVRPLHEEDLNLLGEEIVINVSLLEILDEGGEPMAFYDIQPGTRLTVEYTDYYLQEDWFTSLYAYKITVHED